MTALRALSWDVEGRDWPNREVSDFPLAGGLRWHVQRSGCGPSMLLLHGTGASTHSFRDLLPALGEHFDVLAPDLPGHGFTARPDDPQAMSLPGMAAALKELLRTLGVAPRIVVGHSAGAALLLRLALDAVERLQQPAAITETLRRDPLQQLQVANALASRDVQRRVSRSQIPRVFVAGQVLRVFEAHIRRH